MNARQLDSDLGLSATELELWHRATLELHSCHDMPSFQRAMPKILRQLLSAAPRCLRLLRPHFELARRSVMRRTLAQERRRHAPNGRLTPREAQIGCWLAAGKSNPEIARLLQCRPRTVEKHLEKILEKLGVENRATAAIVLARGNEHE